MCTKNQNRWNEEELWGCFTTAKKNCFIFENKNGIGVNVAAFASAAAVFGWWCLFFSNRKRFDISTKENYIKTKMFSYNEHMDYAYTSGVEWIAVFLIAGTAPLYIKNFGIIFKDFSLFWIFCLITIKNIYHKNLLGGSYFCFNFFFSDDFIQFYWLRLFFFFFSYFLYFFLWRSS